MKLREPTKQFLHDPLPMGSNSEKRRGDSYRVQCVYLLLVVMYLEGTRSGRMPPGSPLVPSKDTALTPGAWGVSFPWDT